MKAITLLLLLFALAVGSTGQTQSPTPATTPLSVLNCSWVRAERSEGSTGDSERKARAAEVDQRIALETRESDPRNEKTKQEVQRLEQTKNASALIPLPAGSVKGYEYRVAVRNASDKTIKRIQWSYVFTDVLTQKELARHTFFSRVKLQPGREKKLSTFGRVSPPGVVNAKALDRNTAKPWGESVVIDSVEFEDGSSWQTAPKGEPAKSAPHP